MKDKLKRDYIEWYQQNVTIEDITSDWKAFITPFEDMFGDDIEFYYKKDSSGKIILSDDGATLFNLECHGVNLNTDSRKNIFSKLLLYHGITNNNNKLEKICKPSRISFDVHKYITGLISINDLSVLSSANVARLFRDDVQDLLVKSGVQFMPNVNVLGKSGLEHNLEFRYGKEKYLKTIGNLTKDKAMAAAYLAHDTGLAEIGRLSVIVDNTKEKPNRNLLKMMSKEKINVMLWSERQEIVSELKAS